MFFKKNVNNFPSSLSTGAGGGKAVFTHAFRNLYRKSHRYVTLDSAHVQIPQPRPLIQVQIIVVFRQATRCKLYRCKKLAASLRSGATSIVARCVRINCVYMGVYTGTSCTCTSGTCTNVCLRIAFVCTLTSLPFLHHIVAREPDATCVSDGSDQTLLPACWEHDHLFLHMFFRQLFNDVISIVLLYWQCDRT